MRASLYLAAFLALFVAGGCVSGRGPAFADGEATAIVQSRMVELDGADSTVQSLDALYHTCLEAAFSQDLREQYLGDGIWRVSSTGEGAREWRVYEASGAVTPCSLIDTEQ